MFESYSSRRERHTETLRAVAELLKYQIANGADAVQIFDTLGGDLPTEDFEQTSGRWMQEIIRSQNGRAPVLVFSKGCRDWRCLRQLGTNGIGIGPEIKIEDAALQLPELTVQGNYARDGIPLGDSIISGHRIAEKLSKYVR
jgi:uroporphyrinogen-III decarboxylase